MIPLEVVALMFLIITGVPGLALSNAALALEESVFPLQSIGAKGGTMIWNSVTRNGSSKSKFWNLASTFAFLSRPADINPSVLPNTSPAASGNCFTRNTLDPMLLVLSPSLTLTLIFNSPPLIRVTSAIYSEPDFLTPSPVTKSASLLWVGREGCFSAGFDLKVVTGGDADAAAAMVKAGGELAFRIFTFPHPVVCAVTGHCLALGSVMLVCADKRIGMAGDFKYGLNETAIDMDLPAFGYEPAVYRLSEAHRFESIVAAQIHSPESALAAGFLDAVAAPEALIDRAMAHASRLGPSSSTQATVSPPKSAGATLSG